MNLVSQLHYATHSCSKIAISKMFLDRRVQLVWRNVHSMKKIVNFVYWKLLQAMDVAITLFHIVLTICEKNFSPILRSV